MSKLGKLKKNAEKFEMQQFYSNMTPEQYREGIKVAVRQASEQLAKEYDRQLYKLRDDFNNKIKESVHITMDTFSIEFLYEVADQLECFVDEPENLEQKIELVQNIYENIMKSIQTYADIKTDKDAFKEFQRKKKQIEKVFNIVKD